MGPEFSAGSIHRFFFGDLWRDAWLSPVQAELLNLQALSGGISVLGIEPDLPAGSLGFRDGDGTFYSFRRFDKDPSHVLPRAVQTFFAGDVLRDIAAATNPFGPLVSAPLLSAVGINCGNTRLVRLSGGKWLGPYEREFDGTAGILSEMPGGSGTGAGTTEPVRRVVGSFELLRLLEEDHENRVNAGEYLKARIMDLYLGDWDRHAGRWQWRERTAEGFTFWDPLPGEYQQAFGRYDGVVPWAGSFVVPQLDGFRETYSETAAWAWSGRHLDRWLLSPLGQSIWDSVTAVITSGLADSVIEKAVLRLPSSVYAREGRDLVAVLKGRRQLLPEAVTSYYRLLAGTVDIRGSDKPELAEILRNDDTHVLVRVFAKDGDGTGGAGRQLYCREFCSGETDEIRLYLQGGDDTAVVTGKVESSLSVRIIAGEGNDLVIDSSQVDGDLFSIVPFIADAETQSYVYDADGLSVVEGSGTEVHRRACLVPSDDTLRYTPDLEDRDTGWGMDVMFDWNAQLGPMAGIGPIHYLYGFREAPYASRLSLLGGYAPVANVGRVVFNADFRSMIRNTSVTLDARASGYEILAYFGEGNETTPLRDPNDEYYRVHQVQFRFEPGIRYPAEGPLSVMAKAGIRYVRTDTREQKYVNEVRPYGIENMVLASVGAGVRWNTRDLAPHPFGGLYVDLDGSFFPKAFTAGRAFGKAKADIRYFYTPGEGHPVTLSLRVLGEKTWGKVPYFESAVAGSSAGLRGYQFGRFAGEASLAGVFEARVRVGELRYILPVAVGLFGFLETGRVFVPGEISRRWHPSYGGGVWAAPWNRETTVTASLGFSHESVLLYGSIGFAF